MSEQLRVGSLVWCGHILGRRWDIFCALIARELRLRQIVHVLDRWVR